MLFVFKINIKFIIASTVLHSFTLVDSRISVFEVNLFMIIRHRPVQMSNDINMTHMIHVCCNYYDMLVSVLRL